VARSPFPYGGDAQAPGGYVPLGPSGLVQAGIMPSDVLPPGEGGSLTDEALARFEDFLRTHSFYTVPVPFNFWRVEETVLPLNTPVWLDQPNNKLSGRRAWAVINTDAVLGNNCWVNAVSMQAAGQGGRVLAQGGTISVPGSEQMNVWGFTNVAAGVTVGFYQFA